MKGNHKKVPLVWNGLKFESKQEMAEKLDTSPQLIHYYLINDKPLKKHYIDFKIRRYYTLTNINISLPLKTGSW